MLFCSAYSDAAVVAFVNVVHAGGAGTSIPPRLHLVCIHIFSFFELSLRTSSAYSSRKGPVSTQKPRTSSATQAPPRSRIMPIDRVLVASAPGSAARRECESSCVRTIDCQSAFWCAMLMPVLAPASQFMPKSAVIA